jgi:hypothetical protein
MERNGIKVGRTSYRSCGGKEEEDHLLCRSLCPIKQAPRGHTPYPFLNKPLKPNPHHIHPPQVIHSDVTNFEVDEAGSKLVRFAFEDGGELAVDLCLYSGGRDANSEKIGCENVGVEIGKYGRVVVDKDFRTANPRIFAIGDVVGPPGLASFAQQAARVVTDLLFRSEDEAAAAAARKAKREEEEASKYAGACLCVCIGGGRGGVRVGRMDGCMG